MEDVPESKLSDLNEAQRARLLKFIKDHGPVWRHKLNNMWLTGDDARQVDGGLLRQIRNDFGPEWLYHLKEY